MLKLYTERALFCQAAKPLSGEERSLVTNTVKFKSNCGDKASLGVASHKALSSHGPICNSGISGDQTQTLLSITQLNVCETKHTQDGMISQSVHWSSTGAIEKELPQREITPSLRRQRLGSAWLLTGHLYHSPEAPIMSGKGGSGKCRNQKLGKRAVKRCLVDMTHTPQSWTHNSCANLHRPCPPLLHGAWGRVSRWPPLTEGQGAVNGCWGIACHFSLVVQPLLNCPCSRK